MSWRNSDFGGNLEHIGSARKVGQQFDVMILWMKASITVLRNFLSCMQSPSIYSDSNLFHSSARFLVLAPSFIV